MSFPCYPECKDSGVEWLGVVPAHWGVSHIKDTTYLKARVGWKGLTSDEFLDTGYSYLVTGSDFSSKQIDWSCCYCVDKERYDDDPYIQLSNGDLLLTKDGTIGKLALVAGLDRPACLNSGVFLIRPIKAYSTEYMYWVLQSKAFAVYCDLSSYGSTIQHLYQNVFDRFLFPTPPGAEQLLISKFIDNETAKIDGLIAEQKKLIALLKEKRQAVISHAVTKGLDPNAPMKDSGIEWLGEVPAHWVVSKFGYISSVVRGGSPRPAGDPELFNGDFSPWVTVAEITKDDEIYLEETESFLTEKGSEQCRVFSKGTLLLSNSGATLGVPKILMLDANANDGVVGFEHLSLNKEYAYYYLSTLTEELRKRAAGSGQPNLNTDIVKSIDVPIPPSNEVAEIVAAVTKLREQFHFLSKEAAEGIRLLQERRSALISAAVTGKIDVRQLIAVEVA